jgi:hypothetical protein
LNISYLKGKKRWEDGWKALNPIISYLKGKRRG